ncbi:hypothetical protein BCR39DRAFT_83963 [Naematelia encephala]|uniref:Uncharacterized protein n=1 Tax=Naematelia encephala TaxID=71784 RepID=A0A1Y2ADY1_9TREE|nr:hypothetical protein BCR39DRAFT_83963 [Naematelia encephala]
MFDLRVQSPLGVRGVRRHLGPVAVWVYPLYFLASSFPLRSHVSCISCLPSWDRSTPVYILFLRLTSDLWS